MQPYNHYEIAVYTNDVENGGTDGDVSIALIGDKGETEFFSLDNEANNFEHGHTDVFFKDWYKSIGNITEINVNLVFKGYKPKWSLGWVKITHHFLYYGSDGVAVQGDNEFHFNCYYAYVEDNLYRVFHSNDRYDSEAAIPENAFSGVSYNNNPNLLPPDTSGPTTPNQSNTQKAELIFTQPGWIEPSLYPVPYTPSTARFEIINVGNKTATDFTMLYQLYTGSDTTQEPIGSNSQSMTLAAGASTISDCPIDGLESGHYTLTAVINSTGSVSEVNIDNNSTFIGFEVGSGGTGIQSTPAELQKSLQVKWISAEQSINELFSGKIQYIGGMEGKRPWSFSVAKAIELILSNQHNFYTYDAEGRRANLYVDITSRPGHPFLRTFSDKVTGNNLSAMPLVNHYFKTFSPANNDFKISGTVLS